MFRAETSDLFLITFTLRLNLKLIFSLVIRLLRVGIKWDYQLIDFQSIPLATMLGCVVMELMTVG